MKLAAALLLCGCGARTELDGARLQNDASPAPDVISSVCKPPPDVLAYFPFDGDTNDHSGNHHDAHGSAFASAAGKLGAAMHFAGSEALHIDDGPLLSDRTLCAWVRPSPTSGLGQPIFVGGATGTGDFYSLGASSSTSGTCKSLLPSTPFIDHWSNADCAYASSALAPGTWHFVCFESTAYELVYADGASSPPTPSSLYNYALSTITLGSNTIGGTTTAAALVGDLDEVTIWSRLLDASELASLWNAGNGCALSTTTSTPTSCADVLAENPSAASGVYTIDADGSIEQAYCDMQIAGGFTAFFSGQVGDTHTFAHFESSPDTCPDPATKCLRHIPASIDTSHEFAARCGNDAVVFEINAAIRSYFSTGAQDRWQPLSNVAIGDGAPNLAYATKLWTGDGANRGWIVSNDDNTPSFTPHTFGSSYDFNSTWNYCNGVQGSSATVRLLYK